MSTGRFVEEFDVVGFLGAGGFGSVLKCRDKHAEGGPERFHAVKRIVLDSQDSDWVLREAANLAVLRHHNIVRYFSAWIEELDDRPSQDLCGASKQCVCPRENRLCQNHRQDKGNAGNEGVMPKSLTRPGSSEDSHGGISFTGSISRLLRHTSLGHLAPSRSMRHFQSPPADLGEEVEYFLRKELHISENESEASDSSSLSSSSKRPSSSRPTSSVPSSRIAPPPTLSSDEVVMFEDESGESKKGIAKNSEGVSQMGPERNERAAWGSDRSNICNVDLTRLVSSDSSTRKPKRRRSQSECGNREKAREKPNRRLCLYISMEYVEGMTLREAINRSLFFGNRELCINIFIQLAEGLAYVHSHKLVHRDLKPENIFLKSSPDDNSWIVKIGDFGLSTLVYRKSESKQPSRQLSAGVGTRFYMAPETFQGSYDESVDLFSLGVILFELFSPRPKTNMERYKLMERLTKSHGTDAELLGVTDRWVAPLIGMLMSAETSSRPAARTLSSLVSRRSCKQTSAWISKIVCSPYSYEMLRVLTVLFDRDNEKSTEPVACFANNGVVNAYISCEIYRHVYNLFSTFNAVLIGPPKLCPAFQGCRSSDAYELLDVSGTPLILPISLIVLLKETLPSIKYSTVVRRFALDHTFRRQSSQLSACYDLCVNMQRLNQELKPKDSIMRMAMFQVDPIKAVWTVLQAYQDWLGNSVSYCVSFPKLLPLILRCACDVPESCLQDIIHLIKAGQYSNDKIVKALREQSSETVDSHRWKISRKLESWLSFDGSCKDLVQTLDRLEFVQSERDQPLIAELQKVKEEIEAFYGALVASIGLGGAIKMRIRFNLSYDERILSKKGVVFGACIPSHLYHSASCMVLKPWIENTSVISVGGALESENYKGTEKADGSKTEGSITSFAAEIHLQSIIDMIAGQLDRRATKKPVLRIASPVVQASGDQQPDDPRIQNQTTKQIPQQAGNKAQQQAVASQKLLTVESPTVLHVAQSKRKKSIVAMSEGRRPSEKKVEEKRAIQLPEKRRDLTKFPPPSSKPIQDGAAPEAAEPNPLFLLLPPHTPLDVPPWLEEIEALIEPNESNPMLLEVQSHWKVAKEITFAPPTLCNYYLTQVRRSSLTSGLDTVTMVLILYSSDALIPWAYALKTKLERLQITATVYSPSVQDIGQAKQKLYARDVCDWLLMVTTTKQKEVMYRLSPSQATKTAPFLNERQRYISRDPVEMDKWFDDMKQLLRSLAIYYLEILMALSPSTSHIGPAR